MRNYNFLLLLMMSIVASTGCLARQVTNDGTGLRQALLDMYTDQAMDNLIRARENRPFVQLAYSSLSVQDQDKTITTAAGNEGDFSHNTATDVTKAVPVTTVTGFIGKFPFGGSGERDRTLSFHADPITNQNSIYESYLRFANNPMLLVTSDQKPTCQVYICRKCSGKWYWVPMEGGNEFMKLVLTTSFIQEDSGTLVYWDTTIDKIKDVSQIDSPTSKYEIILHDSIPNDRGIIAFVPKPTCKPIWRPVEAGSGPLGPPVDEKTKTILFVFSNDPLNIDPGTPARLFLNNYPNPKPKNPDNQKVLDTLDNIRVLLNRVPSTGL
jgi:hypothetical protein